VAINYPSIAVEWLWKTACAFGNPARSYKDFRAEVIALNPEATVAQGYTLVNLDRLVSDPVHMPIHTEMEL